MSTLDEAMSSFRAVQADLFGGKASEEHRAKQAEQAERMEQTRSANLAQGAHMRIADAGIPKGVVAVVRAIQEGDLCDMFAELPDPIPQAIRAFEAGPTRLVGLFGPVGSGKSVAAGYALIGALEGGRHGMWRTGSELGELGLDGDALRRRASAVDRLVIDDLGVEVSDPRMATKIASVILARFDALRPTIVTSNLSDRAELKARYGPQVIDRMMGKGGFAMTCKDQGYRRKVDVPDPA